MKRPLPGTGCMIGAVLLFGLLTLALCNGFFMHGDPVAVSNGQ